MITVSGVEVQSNEFDQDFKISFTSVTEEGQKRLFLENKDKFAINALSSQYEEVRKLAMDNKEELSSEAINGVIEYLLLYEHDIDYILELLDLEQLKLDEELRIKLAYGPYWRLRNWVIDDPNTSDSLKKDLARKGFC